MAWIRTVPGDILTKVLVENPARLLARLTYPPVDNDHA